jgi:hypothetical protein
MALRWSAHVVAGIFRLTALRAPSVTEVRCGVAGFSSGPISVLGLPLRVVAPVFPWFSLRSRMGEMTNDYCINSANLAGSETGNGSPVWLRHT